MKTLMNQKNFKKEVIKKFNARGKLVYGKDFRIAYHRIPLLVEFVNYSMSTKDIAYSTPIIPNKGILLLGHQDSGKTAWMHLVKPFFDEGERYALRSIKEINMKFILYGKHTLSPYLDHQLPLCIDDWTMNSSIIEQFDVLFYILYKRMKKGLPNRHTHLISDMNIETIGQLYSKDKVDFLYKYFNIIEFR